jgi:uncharacterized cofD-like protein
MSKKIVCIGGGTGVSMILSGLMNYPFDLSAVVTMFDDGGSSGRLAKEFHILPPGDVRQCLIATAKNEKLIKDFTFRFTEGPKKGHSQGNFLIKEALDKENGDWNKAIEKLAKDLNAKAKIWPVTLNESKIKAILKNSQEIIGEENIINSNDVSDVGMEKLMLEPEVEANERAVSAIKEADLIVIGPGKFYTSVIPNFLVRGIPEAVKESKAKKVFICNLMTQKGNTDKLKVEDYVKILEGYLNVSLDFVVYNTAKLSGQLMENVRQIFPKSEFIEYGNDLAADKKFIGENFLDSHIRELNPSDILVKGANQRTIVFHNSQKLAEIISKLCK